MFKLPTCHSAWRSLACCLFLSMLFVVMAVALAVEKTRVWTDKSGKFKLEAEFVSVDGTEVLLKKSTGDIIRIPLEKLTPADAEIARKMAKGEDPAPAIEKKRTWTDKSGKFKLEAEFVALEGTEVVLKKSNGDTLRISIEKLAPADADAARALAQGVEANPFAGDRGDSNAPQSIMVGNLKVYHVEDQATPLVEISAEDVWEYVPDPEPASNQKSARSSYEVALPKRKAINRDDRPFFDDLGRGVMMFDRGQILYPINNYFSAKEYIPLPLIKVSLADGKSTSMAKTVFPAPVRAANSDGSRVLAFGERAWSSDTFDVAVMSYQGESFKPLYGWRPFPVGEHVSIGWSQNIRLAGKENAVVVKSRQSLDFWALKADAPRILFSTNIEGESAFGVSRGGKYLAVQQNKGIQLIDTTTAKSVGRIPDVVSTVLSIDFSPDGGRLAVLHYGRIKIYDLQQRAWVTDIRYPDFGHESGGQTPTQWLPDQCLLVNGQYLCHLPTEAVVWKYKGHYHNTKSLGWHGGAMWYQHSDVFGERASIAKKQFPTSEAATVVRKLAINPDYVYQSGAKVALVVNLTTADLGKIVTELRAKLAADGIEVVDQATMAFVIDSKPSENLSYYSIGGGGQPQLVANHTTTVIQIRLMEGNSQVWNTSFFKRPSMFVRVGQGESAAQAIAKTEATEYQLLRGLEFPKKVLRYPEGKSFFGETELFPGR